MTAAPVLTDPAALTPSQWAAKLAAYLSRGRGNDDPGVIACREALAFWRIRRVVDRETGHLSAAGVDRLVAQLHGAVSA
ncbi:MAG: hypothetical protein K0U84_03470 [Actinomycetia bacterium]|nr:hypothetical protein [Actinomycetes bacterium]